MLSALSTWAWATKNKVIRIIHGSEHTAESLKILVEQIIYNEEGKNTTYERT